MDAPDFLSCQVQNVKCRITTGILEAQAKVIAADYAEIRQMRRESGETMPSADEMPSINASWVRRWRKQFRVSRRARTVYYKVSREKLKHRLGVIWRNSIRLRCLHEHFFWPDKLRWRSYDQKPLWFNAVGGSRTLAVTGTKDVDIRENHHATRARFTAMTKSVDKCPAESMAQVRARSNASGDPSRLAVLFKAAEGSRVKASLDVPAQTLVQTGPRGSYRVDTVLSFLEWDLGCSDTADGSTAELVCGLAC